MSDKKSLSSYLKFIPFLLIVGWACTRWPINGWQSLVWLAALVATAFIRAPHEPAYKANTIVKSGKSGLDNMLMIGMVLCAMALPMLTLITDWLSFADYEMAPALCYLGAALLIPGVWLFWRSHADLGRNWSPTVEVHNEQTLVTSGVYAKIRHPMYAAFWLMAIAQPFLVHNWIGGSLLIPIFAWLYFNRIPKEEAFMREKFPTQYEQYCAKTGRVLPI